MIRHHYELKRTFAACVLFLSVAPLRDNPPEVVKPTRPSLPAIIKVEPAAAPSGAVIEIMIQYPGSPLAIPPQVTIGGHLAEIVRSDSLTIVAVVPEMRRAAMPGTKSAPAPIRLLSEGRIGRAFDFFEVLSPGLEVNPNTNIAAVDWASKNENTVHIRFDRDIPVDQWGKVTIVFDDLPVKRFLRMTPRLFTAVLPKDLPDKSSYQVALAIGDLTTPRHFTFQRDINDPGSQVVTSQPAPQGTIFTKLNLIVVGLLLVLIVLQVAWLIQKRRTRQLEVISVDSSPIEDISEDSSPIPVQEDVEQIRFPDELPSELLRALVAGECVLYAGAGLSAQSGLPTWRDLVHNLLNWAVENNFVNSTDAVSYRAEIDAGQTDAVADSVISRLSTADSQAMLNDYLREVFLASSLTPSALHFLLKRMRFSAVLTTNFDNLLDRVYEASPSQVYAPMDAEPLLTALTQREFFILKLYGMLNRPSTVIVAPAQYEDAIGGNRLFAQFMETLFFSRTLLFIGASMEGIEIYLKGISLPKDIARKHWALVAVWGNTWRAKAEFLERRYGIKVLPYTPSGNHAQLLEFLARIAETVASQSDTTTDGKGTTSRLKKLHLDNIGPFENLDLEFDAHWQIFLGDNGVGKSTILKAIALAMCGEKAQPFAGRLLRRDPEKEIEEGRIILETDRQTRYITTIKRGRNGREDEVISTTARPLEAEGWLALGFPPLRTTSWEPLKGPDADIKTKSRPVVEDILPLVKGDVDPRLDKLKQWIVNLDYLRIQSEAEGEGKGTHYLNLVKDMFEVINSVTEGITLVYMGVEKGTNRIIIKTNDGTNIPLEALSQGIISLIGWVGILMQRLYEVFDRDEDPTKRYALILMDEIDAHMHPEWQRTLVNRLKTKFKEAQFIVTTHSPLVVGGMRAAQVTRFARNTSGNVESLPIAPDMTLGYTDQILTSLLFGLSTTLDDTTEKKMQEYYKLLEMEDRSGHHERYETLKQELMARVPPPSSSYEQKREQQLSEADLLRQLGEKLNRQSPDQGQILLERADSLRKTITGGQKDDSD